MTYKSLQSMGLGSFIAALGLSVLVGCNNNPKGGDTRVAGTNGANASSNLNGATIVPVSSSSDPTTLVQSMFSQAGIQNVGTVGTSNAIQFAARLSFPNSYNLNGQNSWIAIEVKDSVYNSGQSGLLEYDMGEDNSSGGYVTTSGNGGNIDVVLQADSYSVPAIRIQGTFTMTNGTPQQMNGVILVGTNNNTGWAQLGTFTTNACSILMCN